MKELAAMNNKANGYDDITWLFKRVGIYYSPALAVYNRKLYLAHQGAGPGSDGAGSLWYMVFDGKTWSEDKKIPHVGISYSPALVVYNGKLYLFHQGAGPGSDGAGSLWYMVFDGKTWSEDKKIPHVGISYSPALAVYNGKLYLAHQGAGPGSDGAGSLWYMVFDGKTWSEDKKIPHIGISYSPALSVYNGNLYLAHRGTDGQLWYIIFNDREWQDKKVSLSLPDIPKLVDAPALSVFNGQLYCAYHGNSRMGCVTFDGKNWSKPWEDTIWQEDQISDSLALVMFLGKLYRAYRDQDGLLNVKRTPYQKIQCSVPLLDVWGEGRIITDGITTGFEGCQNLNKFDQTISNGVNRGQSIPNLVPVSEWDNPTFPIADGVVNRITVMGAPITNKTAQEMYRVLNKNDGVVILYDLDSQSIENFEKNKGDLIYKEHAILGELYAQPSCRPAKIYGFPQVIELSGGGQAELPENSVTKASNR